MKKIIFLGLAALLFSAGINKVNAQVGNRPDPEIEAILDRVFEDQGSRTESVVVATVNLYNGKAELQDGNVWKISFDLFNRLGIQPGVRYGVELRTENTEDLVGQIIYPEVLSLGEGETIQKEVFFTVPDYLKGRFKFWIVSQNESGLTLGQIMATGNVELSGTGKYVEMSSSACSLRISGEDKSYSVSQGVDVLPAEKLTLYCSANNLLDSDVSFKTHFKTTFRTAFGRTIFEEDGENIQLGKGEKRELSFLIPKAKNPQAYDVNVSFQDESGKTVTNSIEIHYVLRGASATIKNATLDKDVYSKGDEAKLSLYWSGRADAFPLARQPLGAQDKMILEVSAFRGDGSACADVFRKNLEGQGGGGLENSVIPILDDCQNGKIEIAIADERGNVLDRKTILLKGATGDIVAKSEANAGNQKSSRLIFYSIAGLLFLIGLGAILIKKGKNANGHLVLLFLFFGTLLGAGGAKAETFQVIVYNYQEPWDQVIAHADYTVSISTEHSGGYFYCPGNPIIINGTGVFAACANTANAFNLRAYYPNGTGTIFWRTSKIVAGDAGRSASGRIEHVAGTVPGRYTARFPGAVFLQEDQNKIHWNEIYVPYTIFSYTVGKCGGADGTSRVSAPTGSGRCDSGTATTAKLNAAGTAWTWKCEGSCGGASPTCSATKINAPTVSATCPAGTPIVNVSWGDYGIGGSGYDVQINTASGNTSWAWSKSTNSTSANVDATFIPWGSPLPAPITLPLVSGTTYYAKVFYKQTSTFGPEQSFTPVCAPKMEITATPDVVEGSGSVVVSWKNTGGAPTSGPTASCTTGGRLPKSCPGFFGAVPISGSVTQNIGETTIFSITASNSAGSSTAEDTATSNPCTPETVCDENRGGEICDPGVATCGSICEGWAYGNKTCSCLEKCGTTIFVDCETSGIGAQCKPSEKQCGACPATKVFKEVNP
jgi:hypothetical protein